MQNNLICLLWQVNQICRVGAVMLLSTHLIDINWIQKFRHNGNGSVKELSADQASAGFAFDDIEYKEEILDLWDNAISPANDQEPTNKVMVGDVFIISNDNDYFLIECTNVEITTTNNSDFYNFKVKQAIF